MLPTLFPDCLPRCIEVMIPNVKTEGVRPAIEVVLQTPINHVVEEKSDLKSRLYTKPVNFESSVFLKTFVLGTPDM